MHRSLPLSTSISMLTILWAALAPAARADLAWHADLQAALAASAVSGKPVIAMFDADWADGSSAAVAEVLANPEVEAVVAACFEPVRLDVDAHAETADELGIEHVPTACIVNAQGERLTSFECPSTPAGFVASAARAAQLAAAENGPARAAAQENTGEAGSAFRRGGKRSADATIAAVSSKVRQLASFAEGDDTGSTPAINQPRYESTTESAFVAAGRDQQDYRVPPPTPALTRSPPEWAAEQPAAPSLTSFQPQPAPQAAPAIEPQPAATTPWLAASDPQPAATPAIEQPPAAAAEPPVEKAPTTTERFVAAFRKPWSIFSRSPAAPAIEPPAPPPTMPPALPQWRAELAEQAPPAARPEPAGPDTHGPMPLGLEGYCPVTVVERGSWVEGRPQWGARHRGRTYLFAGPEQQRAFLADPDRYAPALSGDDPVLAFEGGRSEPGRRAFGVTYQSRMYLFTSPETRAAFTADPDRYTARTMIAEGIAPTDGIRRF